ncbi:hypothetical protein OY671_013075, partial [Metschnikowia pulcherrima]
PNHACERKNEGVGIAVGLSDVQHDSHEIERDISAERRSPYLLEQIGSVVLNANN